MIWWRLSESVFLFMWDYLLNWYRRALKTVPQGHEHASLNSSLRRMHLGRQQPLLLSSLAAYFGLDVTDPSRADHVHKSV
jgi:hypothetical protein